VQGTNIVYKRSALRVAKVVCQCLHFVCCEIVLIPEDMVVSRPTCSLANSQISHLSTVQYGESDYIPMLLIQVP